MDTPAPGPPPRRAVPPRDDQADEAFVEVADGSSFCSLLPSSSSPRDRRHASDVCRAPPPRRNVGSLKNVNHEKVSSQSIFPRAGSDKFVLGFASTKLTDHRKTAPDFRRRHHHANDIHRAKTTMTMALMRLLHRRLLHFLRLLCDYFHDWIQTQYHVHLQKARVL